MDPRPSSRPGRVNRGFLWAAILVTVLGWGPVVCVYFAQSFANAHGCVVNEGFVNPCVVAGHDYGPLLYDFFVMGWLMLLTFPLMLASIVLWIVILVQALRKPRQPF